MIAIIALLMAILLPTLQRIRRQAKAVGCQSNLRQWGTHWAIRTGDNDGYFPGCGPEYWSTEAWESLPWSAGWGWGLGWYGSPYDEPDWYRSSEGIWCCPMATKPANPSGQGVGGTGGTFLAWGRFWPRDNWPWDMYGSYGINSYTCWPSRMSAEKHIEDYREYFVPYFWSTPHVKGASNVPMQLDSSLSYSGWLRDGAEPPVCDAIPTESVRPIYHPPGPREPEPDHEYGECGETPSCINRHDGYVNGLFFDWLVRKVGLKELWTLKWHNEYDTRGPWTKAGGMQPEDWPQWMRRFKDY